MVNTYCPYVLKSVGRGRKTQIIDGTEKTVALSLQCLATVKKQCDSMEFKNEGSGSDEDSIPLQVCSFFLFLIVRDFITIYDFLRFDDY
jgi:hypothetical protein